MSDEDWDWLQMWRRENARHAKAFPWARDLLAKLSNYDGTDHPVIRLSELPHAEIILLSVEGRLFPSGRGLFIFRRGAPNRCHQNAARLWKDSDGFIKPCTGLALAPDGAWRSHSWGLRGRKVVETTVRAVAYFGVVLEDRHAAQFALNEGV